MSLKKFGFIVTGKGLSPDLHRSVMSSASFEMIAIGVSDASEGPRVARALLDEGVQLIELCGGFGAIWTARVIEAVEGKIPVGSVAYGPESIDGMYELFKD